MTTGTGTFEVQAPRVNDKRVDDNGERQRFTSKILPPYMRRSPKVAEVLPILYLRGLSMGDFKPALEGLLGEDAAGLASTNIARLTNVWEDEYRDFSKRSFADVDFVYVWADGIHFNVRLEDDRLCTLVLIGARPDGTKEVIAVEDSGRRGLDPEPGLRRRRRAHLCILDARTLRVRARLRAPLFVPIDFHGSFVGAADWQALLDGAPAKAARGSTSPWRGPCRPPGRAGDDLPWADPGPREMRLEGAEFSSSADAPRDPSCDRHEGRVDRCRGPARMASARHSRSGAAGAGARCSSPAFS